MIHYIRAIILGAVLWALAFGEVLFLVFVLKLDNGLATTIHLIFILIFTILFALFYYKDILIKRGFVSGLLVGVIFAAVGLILDLAISVPLFIKEYSLYFADSNNWIIMAEIILVTGIVSAVKKPRT